MDRHLIVTGASSGIGAATARRLAVHGVRLSLGARRADRLEAVTAEGAASVFRGRLDVTDEESVERFLEASRAEHGPVDALVNNAGLARGTETVAGADGVAWREMLETNVLGVLNITRRVVPEMVARGTGDIVMVGSIAGREPYEGGSVYCGSKAALASIARTLRYEVLGSGLRVTTVDPGMVDTEFSLVRFRGDRERADSVYDGMRPLVAEDVAECIEFALTRPPHVCIDSMLVMPTDQASAKRVHRQPTDGSGT